MKVRPGVKWFARIILGGYAIQILILCFWETFPMEVRETKTTRYEIRRGWGFENGKMPLFGLMPIIDGEPARLAIIDIGTGNRGERTFDLASDIFMAYPEIWPEKVAVLTGESK